MRREIASAGSPAPNPAIIKATSHIFGIESHVLDLGSVYKLLVFLIGSPDAIDTDALVPIRDAVGRATDGIEALRAAAYSLLWPLQGLPPVPNGEAVQENEAEA